jgi:hypothetical protein
MKTRAKTKEPKKSGRPCEFTDEIFTEICGRMSDGKTLRQICKDPQMPNRATVLRWVKNDDGRKRLYEQARQACMDWYADEIIDVAWDTSKDTIKRKEQPDLCNHEWINRSRLKVDTLKFLMAKLHPGRYGDKTQLELPAAGPTQIQWIERKIVGSDEPALRERVRELESMLGLESSEPAPPKLLTYDPGPLPSRTEGQILYSIAQAIKRNVPKADQRPPEEVISEVMDEFEKLLQAKYQTDALADIVR